MDGQPGSGGSVEYSKPTSVKSAGREVFPASGRPPAPGLGFTAALFFHRKQGDSQTWTAWHRACLVTPRTSSAHQGAVRGRVGTSTILLVEDEADCADMLCAFLVSHGYRVVVAYNGAEALQRLVRDRPDLILSDVMMPVMDGVEMARRLSQDEVYRSIPLAFITAVPGWRIARDCQYAAYLRKPLDLDLLLDTVSRLTRRQPEGQEQERSFRAES